MRLVSAAYKESMKQPLRNRGYMRVVFDSYNIGVQKGGTITGSYINPHSDYPNLFKNGTDDFVYAYLEKDFIKIDGMRYFVPTDSSVEYLEKSLMIDYMTYIEAAYRFTVSFDDNVYCNHLVFNFGDNYPVDFDITDSNGDVYEVRDNDQRILEIEHEFVNINKLNFKVTRMKNSGNRFRLYLFQIVINTDYENDKILDSSLNYKISPVNEVLPTADFSVKLNNEDHAFDIDDPKSVLNYFDSETNVNVYYGYDIDENTIEWIHGGSLFCNDFTVDHDSATITARDEYQNRDKEYYEGSVGSISLYDLAEKVLARLGVTDYTLAPELRTIYTTNPLPRMSCREALQLIANMGKKKLLLTREGGLKIGDEFFLTFTSYDDYFGKLNSVIYDTEKVIYSLLDNNVIKVDGTRLFTPTNSSEYLETGFVSNDFSGEDGYFVRINDNVEVVENSLNNHIAVLEHILQTNAYDSNAAPSMGISISEVSAVKSIIINFGATICNIVKVTAYIDWDKVDEVIITDNDSELLEVPFTNNLMNRISIQFIKTAESEQRVYVDSVQLVSGNDYTMTQNDMLSHPSFTKFAKIKDITVSYYFYQLGDNEDKLSEEEIYVENINDVFRFYMTEPCSQYRLTVSSGTASIQAYGNYYIDVKFSGTGTKTLTIYGKKYTVTERKHIKNLNDRGESVTWENPLVNSQEKAEELADWLADYYTLLGTYEYETRGDPALDVNDIVYQEHYTGKKLRTLITEIGLNFNGAFSGNVNVLRLGGE